MKNASQIAQQVAIKFAEKVDVPPDFQGNPKVHGIDSPRGGGFSIMQTLQEALVKEEKKDQGTKKAMATRVAMYWYGKDRTYRLTKGEQGDGAVLCPKCRGEMASKKFTRSERMYSCVDCGFMVPTGKVVKKKIEIEIEPNGEVEVVKVTNASIGRILRRTNYGF